MSVFNIFSKKGPERVSLSKEATKNEYPELPSKSLLFKTNTHSDFAIVNSLTSYDNAVREAEDLDHPNRYNLLKYYNDVKKKDGHLINLYRQRVDRVIGMPYSLVGNKGEQASLDSISGTPWFHKILRLVMESVMEGNSLIEVIKTADSKIAVNLIPRENIIPEFQQVKEDSQSIYGTSYMVAPYKGNLIDVNSNDDQRDLGLMVTLARLSLIKQAAKSNWSEFIETYMQPLAQATTDSMNPAEIANIERFLRTMGRRKYIVKNSQTELDFVSTAGNANPDIYNQFLASMDNEMSEVVLGASMLTSDGSSRSQAEVHAKQANNISKQDMTFVTNAVNHLVLPILISKGIVGPKTKFQFDDLEMITVEEKLAIDQFIADNFKVDPRYFQDRYNIPYDLKPKDTDG